MSNPVGLPVVVERRSGHVLAMFDHRHCEVGRVLDAVYQGSEPTQEFDYAVVGADKVGCALLKCYENGYVEWRRSREPDDSDDDFVIRVKMGPVVWSLGTYEAIMAAKEANEPYLH